MSKGRQDRPEREGPRQAAPSTGQANLMWAVVAGLAVLAIVGWMNYRESTELRKDLKARFDQIDRTVAQLGTKVDAVAAGSQRRPAGPDPNRVYTIKTDGSPSKGPTGAPVVIAEFSDFQ